MAAEPGTGDRGVPVPVLPIPEIRDYEKINAELILRLDDGHARVRLAGAEGQRLLVAGLRGNWRAVVELEGRAGPELAAGLDAPGLTVVCLGEAADGAGSRLRNGRLVIGGNAGPAVGYAQEGGAIVVLGGAGPRAGLNQSGGLLVLLGAVGRLVSERQAGGVLTAPSGNVGPHAGRGRRGGSFLLREPGNDPLYGVAREDAEALRAAMTETGLWPIPDGASSDLPGRFPASDAGR